MHHPRPKQRFYYSWKNFLKCVKRSVSPVLDGYRKKLYSQPNTVKCEITYTFLNLLLYYQKPFSFSKVKPHSINYCSFAAVPLLQSLSIDDYTTPAKKTIQETLLAPLGDSFLILVAGPSFEFLEMNLQTHYTLPLVIQVPVFYFLLKLAVHIFSNNI